MNKATIDTIFQTLQKNYSNPKTELIYTTPFQLLVAVMLSAQTTDKQVNKVTEHFFDIIQTPKDLVAVGEKKFESLIAWVNYYKTKAKHIFATAQRLILLQGDATKKEHALFLKKRGYLMPDTLKEMVSLPWVGEKTAKVLLHVLFGALVIPVDTHVHRVTNRLGIVKTKTPLETSKLLEKSVPNVYKVFAHHALILFWRYHCTARNPKCETCPLASVCAYYKKKKKK